MLWTGWSVNFGALYAFFAEHKFLSFLDPLKVLKVKKLYEDLQVSLLKKRTFVDRFYILLILLQLPRMYELFEEESYKIITTHIQQVSRGLPHDLFFKILEKIYRRNA